MQDHEITQLLHAVAQGDQEAAQRLIPLVYEDLRAIAAQRRKRWRGDDTLNATALVHEAYVRLIERTGSKWYDREHFYAVASRAMRQLLLNYAQRKRAAKRGGGAVHEREAEPACQLDAQRADNIVAVDQLLTQLQDVDPIKASIVELRFFGGLENDEIAKTLGVSSRTVQRQWQRARAWMHTALAGATSQA